MAMVVGFLAAFLGFSGAQEYSFERQDAVAVEVGVRAIAALKPAYRLAEGISDGLFEVLREGLFAGILRNAPKPKLRADSFAAFERHFRRKQERLLKRLSETYRPRGADWDWAADAQKQVVLDSLRDTLMDRYQIDTLGRWAETFAKERNRRDPSALAGAGVIGGAFLYFGGGHAQAKIGDLRVGLDMASLRKISKAADSDGDLPHAAGVELRRGSSPWSLNAGMGIAQGRVVPGTYALRYRLVF